MKAAIGDPSKQKRYAWPFMMLVWVVLASCSPTPPGAITTSPEVGRAGTPPFTAAAMEPQPDRAGLGGEAYPAAETPTAAEEEEVKKRPRPCEPGPQALADKAPDAAETADSDCPPLVRASETPSVTAAITSAEAYGVESVIGISFEGRPIVSTQFGQGPLKVIFVGGMHGGYEWNTILLAYQAIDYFQEHPGAVPEAITLVIIPSANPDGQAAVVGQEGRFDAEDVPGDTVPGRFNGRGVDLNRNWDCGWEPSSFWGQQPVSGGMAPFSEPESRALRDFFLEQRPAAVIFWHSSADGVYGAGCPELFRPSRELAEIYGSAAGYPAHDHFDYYPISGDAGDWLATQGIASFTVELSSHELVEWPRNLAGMRALLDYLDERLEQVKEPE